MQVELTDKKYSMPIQLNIETYTEESDHKITVLIDSIEITSKTFKKNTVDSINFNETYDFIKPGFYNLTINWNGDKECKEKYFKIKVCKINNEIINTLTVNVEPFENEYINELKSINSVQDEEIVSLRFIKIATCIAVGYVSLLDCDMFT